MARLALDPFTPEQPLLVAQRYVALIHGVLERRHELDVDTVRAARRAVDVAASKTEADVRYDAERLMYLAERANADGFAVHDQLIAIATEHETEIKRLGNDVIREYKALARKLALPQKLAAALREVIEEAERFQDAWLTIVRQMRHRALAIGRRPVPELTLVAAGELYLAALAEVTGAPDGIALKPRIAGDLIVYEMTVPLAAERVADTAGLVRLLDALHERVDAVAPALCGALALRVVIDADAP
ncbi:hypothetical protein [Azospirillum sp. ST 5-10]|uniref:hypothetical protein n=1 Tax=unclassified Azospirillum TaxID=2630922 RepID=UPI003F49E0EA